MEIIEKMLLLFMNEKQRVNYYRYKGVKIGGNVTLIGKVNFGSEPFLIRIGDSVRISSNVSFITHDGGVHVVRNIKGNESIDKFGSINIGKNVFIGMNSIIMPGVDIGENSIIGAGSVVTKSFCANSIVAGVPAKHIKTVDQYIEENTNKFEYTKGMTLKNKREYLLSKYIV